MAKALVMNVEAMTLDALYQLRANLEDPKPGSVVARDPLRTEQALAEVYAELTRREEPLVKAPAKPGRPRRATSARDNPFGPRPPESPFASATD